MGKVIARTKQCFSFLKARRTGLQPVGIACLACVVAIVIVAVFAGFIAPYSPYETNLSKRLVPPFWQKGGSLAHPLGTDLVGRDILSRLIFGARVSLAVAVVAVLLAGGIGLVVGMIAGYFGGRLDAILMRLADGFLTFPIVFIALLLVMLLGHGFINLIIAIVLFLWARYARVIRGATLTIKERDFIALARICGASWFRIIRCHILPNVFPTFIVLATLQVGLVIMVEATLSFLGAGVPPPIPAWGSMAAEGRNYLTSAWWISIMPGLAIMITVLSLNMLGDELGVVLDPSKRKVPL